MYTNSKSRKSNHGYGRGIVMGILLVFVVIACGLTIGARLNSDVEVNPSAVDEAPVATAEPEVVYVAPVATATPAPAAAPAATSAPVVATAQPVEQFPIAVQNGNSAWGPYWVNPQKAELSVEPEIVGHIDSLASYADNGWFTAPYHTVDAIDQSQLSLVSIYGAQLPNVGDANMRSEDHGKQGVELARALYEYVTRIDGTAWTLKAEQYDEDVHILVGFLFVGQEKDEYWTVWENHKFGYYTLCYLEKGQHPVVETPVYQQPTQPTQPTDPQPTTPPEDTDWTFQPVDEPPVEEDPIDWGTPDEWTDDTDWTFQPVDETPAQETGIDWGTGWEDTTTTTEDTSWTFQPVVEVVSEDTGINWGAGWEDSSSYSSSYEDTSFTFVVESAPAPAAAPVVEAAPAVSAPAADTSFTFDSGSESTSGSSDIDWGEDW